MNRYREALERLVATADEAATLAAEPTTTDGSTVREQQFAALALLCDSYARGLAAIYGTPVAAPEPDVPELVREARKMAEYQYTVDGGRDLYLRLADALLELEEDNRYLEHEAHELTRAAHERDQAELRRPTLAPDVEALIEEAGGRAPVRSGLADLVWRLRDKLVSACVQLEDYQGMAKHFDAESKAAIAALKGVLSGTDARIADAVVQARGEERERAARLLGTAEFVMALRETYWKGRVEPEDVDGLVTEILRRLAGDKKESAT